MNASHLHDKLPDVSQGQLERLSYIDFRLYFLGELRRVDLMKRFGIGSAGATRDIAMYKQLAPDNLDFDTTAKVYLAGPSFQPQFQHAPQRVLTALSRGFGEGLGEDLEPLVRCEFPVALTQPEMSVLAPITRAISRKKAVRIKYVSNSSGPSERELIPSALVDSGLRWHVRAFDRKSGGFKDFVLTRITAANVLEKSNILPEERVDHDIQWNRIVQLELIPHPSRRNPEVAKLDFGMQDGVKRINVRAAMAGYLLQRWRVDCSPEHSLKGEDIALWLRDPLALYGVESAAFAPGYQNPRET
jgi:predicted DNA-binding transcriptional regulator YafY